MADYRLDCCGGFPSHKDNCPALLEVRKSEATRFAQEVEKRHKWNAYFDSLSEESLFKYIDLVDREIKRLNRYVERRNHALSYLREKGKVSRYMEWKRNDNERKVQE